jgi:hypothetical protein
MWRVRTAAGGVVLAAAVLGVAVLAGAGGARAASGQGASAVAHPAALSTGYQVKGELYGVAATSRGNAWAVGMRESSGGVPMTLLLHWNGTKWTPVTSPKPVPGDQRLGGRRDGHAEGADHQLRAALERQGLERAAQPRPGPLRLLQRRRRLRF